MNSFTLGSISRLYNPNILLTVMTLKFLIVSVEVSEFVGKDVGVRHEVKVMFSKSFLHFYYVVAESVLPCDLVGRREVVDLLVLVKTLVQVRLASR
jgi:hypothetical protein